MRKLILFLFLFTSLSFCYSQERNIEVNETERLIDKYGDKIINSFEKAVDELAPYTKEGFEIVVRLKFAEGIFYLSLATFLIIISIILLAKWKSWVYDNDFEIGAGFFIFYSIIASSILYYWGIMMSMVPEWFAIKEIIKLI